MLKTLKHWIFSAIIVYATVFSVFTIKGCKEPNQKDRKHRLKRIQPESERKGLSQDTTNLKAALKFEYDHSSKEFRGSTNLPDNTKLIIVINDSKGFIDESFVLFTKRNFFSYKLSGEDNFTGKKNIELLTYFNHSWQSPEVLKKLNGLSGSLIKNNDGEKYIRIKQSVVFPIEQSPFERSQKAEKKKDKYIFDMRGNLVLKLKETSPPLTDRKSNALTKIENDSDCLKWRIIEDTYGATTEDSLDKLAEYTQTKEYNLVEKMLNRGELIMLKKGETVYLEDYKFLSGAAKIRVANTQIILIVVNEMIKQNCTLQ